MNSHGKNEGWMKSIDVEPSKTKLKNGEEESHATQADFVYLQESFDSVSRATNAIRRIARDLMKFEGIGAQDIANGCAAFCKAGERHISPT